MEKGHDKRRAVPPRDQARSIKLTEGTGGIIAMCPCDDFLELYKEDTTFRFETPETIDPGRTNPNAPFAAGVSDRIGSSNPIIARVLLQGRAILRDAVFEKPVDDKAVVRTLHAIKEALVACHKAADHVRGHVETIAGGISKGGLMPDRSGVLTSLPQVPDLDQTATQFLISAKRAIKNICGLVPLFIPVDRVDSNFDHLGDRLEKLLGGDVPITMFVRAYAGTARYLIDLRNWQEHPRPEKSTRIDNFRMQPDSSIREPTWYATGEPPGPVHTEMGVAIGRMVEMAEWTLIYLVDLSIDTRFPFFIREIDQAAIDPKNPIKYRLSVDVSRLTLAERDDGQVNAVDPL